jgi:electron transfer flavoprotein beta subunit
LLIIALLKGVPARTTQVVQVGGVLNREAMDLVLNPHDTKAIEAADFLKRRVGGKTVALSMGPDMKLIPLMKPLYNAEVLGVDEEYVLSDRRMAGSDTLATSYAVAFGIKKLLEDHTRPLQELSDAIKKAGYSDKVRALAQDLYRNNLLPNRVYSELPSVRGSVVQKFLDGELTAAAAVSMINAEKERLSKLMIVAGIKTTDGETGSVGPQVAEGVSELLGIVLPHATYVEDFDVDPQSLIANSTRMIGSLEQSLEMRLPALITVSTEYRPRRVPASSQEEVRMNDYRGKVLAARKLTADDIGADPKRLGLAGSPTIVGAGIDVGKPPVQKFVGRSLVFTTGSGEVEFEGKKYGPFTRGDMASGLPDSLVSKFKADGTLATFGYDLLAGELFS